MKLIRSFKTDLYAIFIFFVTCILTVADWFLVPGRSANMDGIVHTITPNLFYLSIKQGEFPVNWVDGFANYGLPLGVISHQTTTYLTAFAEFLLKDPVVAFNIVAFLGFFLSLVFFYFFLRIYFAPIFAFAGAILFHFSTYRILNIYIRGALPEFFAGVFIPLMLIGLYLVIKKGNVYGLFLLSLSVALLALTHPFMLAIGFFILFPYLIYLCFDTPLLRKKNLFGKKLWNIISLLTLFSLTGIGLASYFIIPLSLEIKYFYYGLVKNHLTPGNFLDLSNYFDPNWYYFTKLNILPRGFVVNFGLVETLVIVVGLFLLIYLFLKRKTDKSSLLFFAIATSLIIIFFTTKLSSPFYQNINFLSNIQFPWRLLNVLIFMPPIIAAFALEKINKKSLVILFILAICLLRFPQLYGKNYVLYPASDYAFTSLNLHAVVMNPIWTGESDLYPIKRSKPEIIEGNGQIKILDIKNNRRLYEVVSSSPLKMADYTFYFPGWNVYVNGQKTQIEYQDPNYRGVITYNIPQGINKVDIRFEDTKVRLLGKLISLFSLVIITMLFLLRRKISFG